MLCSLIKVSEVELVVAPSPSIFWTLGVLAPHGGPTTRAPKVYVGGTFKHYPSASRSHNSEFSSVQSLPSTVFLFSVVLLLRLRTGFE
jgi:hypothetical protein